MFPRAQHWLNRWYETDGVEVSFSLIKLLGMIIYYELGYHSLLESECESAYKNLRKRKRLGKLESECIRFFKYASLHPGDPGHENRLKKFHENLVGIGNDPEQNMLFEYFDFPRWTAWKMRTS